MEVPFSFTDAHALLRSGETVQRQGAIHCPDEKVVVVDTPGLSDVRTLRWLC